MLPVKVIEEVINILEDKYPNVLPTKQTNDFELGKLVGCQEVIHYLYGVADKVNHDNSKVSK